LQKTLKMALDEVPLLETLLYVTLGLRPGIERRD